MILALLAYFRYPDEYVHSIASYLINQQMTDGGWNCEFYKGATHSIVSYDDLSAGRFVRVWMLLPRKEKVDLAKPAPRGHEFLLAHRLYKSHRTGKVFDAEMTTMPLPPRSGTISAHWITSAPAMLKKMNACPMQSETCS